MRGRSGLDGRIFPTVYTCTVLPRYGERTIHTTVPACERRQASAIVVNPATCVQNLATCGRSLRFGLEMAFYPTENGHAHCNLIAESLCWANDNKQQELSPPFPWLAGRLIIHCWPTMFRCVVVRATSSVHGYVYVCRVCM